MKGRQIIYSPDEMAWLEANRLLAIGDYTEQFCRQFGRPDVQTSHLHALRKRKRWKTGRTGCFEAGIVPHNKGKPCAPGTGGRHPNAQRTQFRKGSMSGVAQRKYKPIGTERITEDGYRERKVHDGMPRQSRWQLVHRIEWEAINGPVPKGMALKCLSDRSDTSPANWELIPRALLPRLDGRFGRGFETAPAELKPTIMAVVKLEHGLRERRKGSSVSSNPRNTQEAER